MLTIYVNIVHHTEQNTKHGQASTNWQPYKIQKTNKRINEKAHITSFIRRSCVYLFGCPIENKYFRMIVSVIFVIMFATYTFEMEIKSHCFQSMCGHSVAFYIAPCLIHANSINNQILVNRATAKPTVKLWQQQQPTMLTAKSAATGVEAITTTLQQQQHQYANICQQKQHHCHFRINWNDMAINASVDS